MLIRNFFSINNNKISFKNNLPLYKVDNGMVHNLEEMPELATGKRHWVRWCLSENNKKYSSELNEIMNGKKLYFQYRQPDNIIKEIVFNLRGVKEVINEIAR